MLARTKHHSTNIEFFLLTPLRLGVSQYLNLRVVEVLADDILPLLFVPLNFEFFKQLLILLQVFPL